MPLPHLPSQQDTIVRMVSDGVIIIDTRGIIRSFNRAAERQFGYAAGDVLGRNVSALAPPEHAEQHDSYIAHYLETGEARVIGKGRAVEGQRRDGTRFPLDLSISEILVDGERWFIGITHDTSAIKQAEAELARKHAELELAARFDRISARVMIALSPRDEHEAPEATILRVLADEAGYRPLAFYAWDADADQLRLASSLGLSPGSRTHSYELGEGLVGEAAERREATFVDGGQAGPFTLDTGFGVVEVASLFAVPLIRGDELLGVVAGASIAPLHSRERARLEQLVSQITIGLYAIRQYHGVRALSDELDERARTIEAQDRKLAQANRTQSEFLATMSHELRTPLNAIIGFTNILLKNKRGNLLAKDLSFLQRVLVNGKHLLALISDILSLSQFEAGRLSVELEEVDLEAAIRECLAQIGVHAESSERALTINIPSGLSAIRADRRRLKQVLINLIGNAIKFTNRGAIELRVHAVDDTPVRVDVIDSGIGIPSDQLAHVTDAFRQVDGSNSRHYDGSGLGLTISKTFCVAMGFDLVLDSVEGEGTIAAIVLSERAPPLRYEPPSTTGARPMSVLAPVVERESSPDDHSGRTILVIDDDPDSRSVIQQLLDGLGYRVITVDSGARGLEIARATRPSLVVIDLVMEGMDGVEVLDAFRDDPTLGDIPTVVCSIYANEYRHRLDHAIDVIPKPIDSESFGPSIRRIFESH